MSIKKTKLIVELIGKNKWKLYKPFDYCYHKKHDITIIFIPKGFVTDFASVPRFFWNILSPIDKHAKAAVVHDYLYRTTEHKFSRKDSDLIFKEILEKLNVKKWKTFFMFWSVRFFGKGSWVKND